VARRARVVALFDVVRPDESGRTRTIAEQSFADTGQVGRAAVAGLVVAVREIRAAGDARRSGVIARAVAAVARLVGCRRRLHRDARVGMLGSGSDAFATRRARVVTALGVVGPDQDGPVRAFRTRTRDQLPVAAGHVAAAALAVLVVAVR
jgi:hypothetical protein